MIQEFSALGGVVKNIVPSEHGLSSRDPAEPVLIRVPPELLIRSEHVEFLDDRIVIDKSAEIPEPVRSFFHRYANTLGLRTAHTAEAIAFFSALAALPDAVRQVLATDFGLSAPLQDDTASAARNQILNSRRVFWRRGRAIAPIIELARYAPDGLKPERGRSLQIYGYASKEIVVRFARHDPLSAFALFGRAVPETAAFSLPMQINVENFAILIGRNPDESKMRGKDPVPAISTDGQKITLSYLLLGERKSPALPRSICRTVFTEAGIQDPDEAFDRIVRSNALKFINLLQGLEPHEGSMTTTLRTMARYQLEALAYCIGSRQLAPS
ncbi:MAG: hypothetical protein JO056_11570 [Alphaproteobacteria bacterium]|nr:hypothetical protein [Alphaproteobacteria bacterium]